MEEMIANAADMQQEQESAAELQQADNVKAEMWYKHINFEDAKAFIKTNIVSAARSFIAIGYYLKHIRDNELYQEDGHATIWEFAQAEYGISKSTASRYMTMNDRFSKGGNSPMVDERYRDFDKSKLQEMLSLTDEQLEQVTPEMRVQDIRSMRMPREIPYFELPGRLDLETDFPEVLPELAQQARPEARTFMLNIADLVGDEEPERPIEPEQVIAISQQQEQVNATQEETEYQRKQEWLHRCEILKELCDDLCYIKSSVLEEAEYSMEAIRKISNAECVLSSKHDYNVFCRKSRWHVKERNGKREWIFESGELEQHIWNFKRKAWGKERAYLEQQDASHNMLDTERVIDTEFIETTEMEVSGEDLTDLQLAREELERENNLLRKCLLDVPDEDDIHIRRMKIKVAALESLVCDLDDIENPPPKPEQPELPMLRNNDQRAAFVDAYETWPLWVETKETGERYYRYDLSDGTSMVVKVYRAKLFDYSRTDRPWEERYTEGYGRHEYYLLHPEKFFRNCEVNRSALIEKLKEIQKKGKT